MSATRKQRGDARLKTLKSDLQAEIFSRCKEGNYADVAKWLKAEWSIKTSAGALSEFYSWYALQQRFAKAQSHVDQLADMVKQSGLPVDASRMKDTMNAVFLSLASQSGDFETFEAAYKLILKGEQLDQEKRRIKLLEDKAAQAVKAKEVIESNLSPEEQRRRLKEILK